MYQLIPKLLSIVFHHLYHSFAWSYDIVSGVVSLGSWNRWILAVLPFINGNRVLELGHGPGHLQIALRERGFQAFGLDESRQMSRQAHVRISKRLSKTPSYGYAKMPLLARGLAQHLPFPSNCFDSLVATFPSQYILNPHTVQEAYRVLRPGGNVVILLTSWIVGRKILERFAGWLFRFTGESQDWQSSFASPFIDAGFSVDHQWVSARSAQVLIILARRPIH